MKNFTGIYRTDLEMIKLEVDISSDNSAFIIGPKNIETNHYIYWENIFITTFIAPSRVVDYAQIILTQFHFIFAS